MLKQHENDRFLECGNIKHMNFLHSVSASQRTNHSIIKLLKLFRINQIIFLASASWWKKFISNPKPSHGFKNFLKLLRQKAEPSELGPSTHYSDKDQVWSGASVFEGMQAMIESGSLKIKMVF